MKKLIKLSNDNYVVVDDSEIKDGDYCLMFDNFGNLFLGNEPKQYLGECAGHFLNKGLRKVTHSTERLNKDFNDWFDVQIINLSEVEELVNGYSVEKMAESIKKEFGIDSEYWYFIKGFKAHKELVKDKLFTKEDMKNAIKHGLYSFEDFDRNSNYDEESRKEGLEEIQNDYIQEQLQPTKWLVEFDENGKLKLL